MMESYTVQFSIDGETCELDFRSSAIMTRGYGSADVEAIAMKIVAAIPDTTFLRVSAKEDG